MERILSFQEAKEAAHLGKIGLRVKFPEIIEGTRTIQPAEDPASLMVTHVVPGIYQPVDLSPYEEAAKAIEAARARR